MESSGREGTHLKTKGVAGLELASVAVANTKGPPSTAESIIQSLMQPWGWACDEVVLYETSIAAGCCTNLQKLPDTDAYLIGKTPLQDLFQSVVWKAPSPAAAGDSSL